MRHLPVLLIAGLIAGCAATPPREQTQAQQRAAAPASPVAMAQPCVELAQIREARVVDDRTIDFHLRDGRTLRNQLPHACPSLGFERAFSYSTSLTRLCSTDIITVIHQAAGPRAGASCGLGQFAPYTPPPVQQ